MRLARKARDAEAETSTELSAALRLAAIVESSTDAMIGKTLDGVITSWNSGAERMYGYKAADIIGRNVSLLIPAARPEELSAMMHRVADGERIEHFETERIRKSGDLFDASVTVSPIRDRAGTIVGASTVTRDITERKRTEAALRDLQERVHQAQRLESVGQLAGGIAHDFNNLLAGLMNYASLASNGLAELTNRLGLGRDPTAVALSNDIAEITHVATRAARLTQQLMVFSHREITKTEMLDLNAIVIDIESLLRRTIGATIKLETDLAPNLARAQGDRGQIEQILMNLAVNARDAMRGGGTLRIATSEGRDDCTHHDEITRGPYLRLAVSDTGCGMSPDVAARAFEPFFTTKKKGEGSGLGLATVYGIVAQAGGNIVISSEPGVGTNVEVMLPATDAIASAVPEESSRRSLAARGETILLVEDEAIVREPTRRILVNNGYTVLVAASAEQAIRTAANHQGAIDLLLTDVVMPGRSGRELMADVQRARSSTKVLYMSGYTFDIIAGPATLESEVALIQKPFAAEDLLRRLREVLEE